MSQASGTRSGAAKWVLLGCGALVLVGVIGIGVVAYLLTRALGGSEVVAVLVEPDRVATASWPAAAAVPHAVWLEYDVAHGGTFRLEGPLEVRTATAILVQDTIALGPEGPPTAAGWGRIETDSRHVTVDGRGTSAGRVRLVEVPPQAPGTVLAASVTIARPVGVLIRRLRLVVTR